MEAILRRPSIVKESGPYRCVSYADGRIEVKPTWPQYPPYDPEHGGGPGIFGRMGLARELERWLNAPYKEPPA